MGDHPAELKEFERLQARLRPLIDDNPAKAIDEARALPSGAAGKPSVFACLKAAILIDAGSCIADRVAIADGVALFRELLSFRPDNANFHYNLGNGLVALADQEPYSGFDWYLITAETRREARSLLQLGISLDSDGDISSTAFTNLGNALWKAHRWAEAYDAYSRALEFDASNGVAATGAVKVLLRCVKHRIGCKEVLLAVAARYLDMARKCPERIAELAGTRAYKELSALMERKLEGGCLPDLSSASDYERFIAANRLALSPTIEGLDPSLTRWDSLRIKTLAEPIETDFGVPALFAMFNVMKSDFLAARYLAFRALSGTFPDSGSYADTLDYAVYGVKQSMLSLAQRACVDILDKVAVATTEYFAINDSDSVYFTNRWFARPKKQQSLSWHPSLNPHVQNGNTALIALAELSLDVREGGSLYQKKAYRHSSTHRFTVLHDIGCDPSRQSDHVEHCSVDSFESHLVESLQMVRAAVLYFVEMISIGERAAKGSGEMARIEIPSHHFVRGEDD